MKVLLTIQFKKCYFAVLYFIAKLNKVLLISTINMKFFFPFLKYLKMWATWTQTFLVDLFFFPLTWFLLSDNQ